jgi:hypothetical protein
MAIMEKPLINETFQLQKFKGKGGWTYAELPGILQDKTKPFGWVTVKGRIDDHQFSNYKLMPMGKGRLFFPVKSDIRKKIGKEAGDMVLILLYPDDSLPEIPAELLACLESEPVACKRFLEQKPGVRKTYIDWIYSAKKETTRVERIILLIERLLKNEVVIPKVKSTQI